MRWEQLWVAVLCALLSKVAWADDSCRPCGGNCGEVLGTLRDSDAFSNGARGNCTGTGRGFYQCVEYAKRFNGRTGERWGNANQIFNRAERLGLRSFRNGGTEAPRQGDAITFQGGRYGHIAIIYEVGLNFITLIEQNWHNIPGHFRRLDMNVEDGRYTVISDSRNYTVEGWLRPSVDPRLTDDDGDRFSESDGDCNDGNASIYPGAIELCNNTDDDCDTGTDEDWPLLGASCEEGLGECRRSGSWICDLSERGIGCNAVAGRPSPEVCDHLDNDCDGETDEEGIIACPGPEMVSIACFCIDRYEASRPTATSTSTGWPGYGVLETGLPRSVFGVLPWDMVTWGGARAACIRAGKRLCLASEWHRACQGSSGRAYPYGDTYDAMVCNGWEDAVENLAPTGSFTRCVTSEGIYDLSGNVWEWIENDFSTTTDMGRLGGSFVNDGNRLLLGCTVIPFPVTDPECASEIVEIDPETGWPSCGNVSNNIGFRCCWP